MHNKILNETARKIRDFVVCFKFKKYGKYFQGREFKPIVGRDVMILLLQAFTAMRIYENELIKYQVWESLKEKKSMIVENYIDYIMQVPSIIKCSWNIVSRDMED